MSVTVTVQGKSGTNVTATNGDVVNVTLSPTGTPGGVGPQGPAGPATSLSIGNVFAGDTAGAAITGTAPNQVLSLTLPKGDKGSTGSQGPQGPTGPAGPANSLTIGTVTSGTAAATITGTAPSQVLNLTLPAGPKGDTGATGPAGPANTLSIGAVNSGSTPSATITGTAPNQILNLVLARGDAGATGATGATGPANSLTIGSVTDGVSAGASITGTAPTQTLNLTLPYIGLSIGTVTTGAAGSSAAATITGTGLSRSLNLTIPKGDKGDAGSGGGSFSWSSVPASSSSSGTAGSMAYDSQYLYVATAANTWKRSLLSAWTTAGITKLLMHFDTTTGSGSEYLADSSPAARAVGGVSSDASSLYSTSIKKFGASSLSLSGNAHLSTSSSSDFDWSAGDAVIEGWFRTTATSTFQTICSTSSSNNDGATSVVITGDNGLSISRPGLSVVTGASVSANTWYHFACVKSGSTARIYIDGVLVGSGPASDAWSSGSAPFSIGKSWWPSVSSNFAGYIDDLRVTVGSDRGYTGSTITVPTAAYPDA